VDTQSNNLEQQCVEQKGEEDHVSCWYKCCHFNCRSL